MLLDQYLTYSCLTLGPATLGQYLDLQLCASQRACSSEKNCVISKTIKLDLRPSAPQDQMWKNTYLHGKIGLKQR
jgi:hypothetical protein